MTNLFGHSETPHSLVVGKAKRKPTVKRGYAMPPGTGPAGETCKTCAHIVRPATRSGARFRKCGLIRANWTHGEGTDILAGSPACAKWAKPEGEGQ
jgi:hypothetical protein